MNNEKLQETYQQMHSQGPTAWFGDGAEERQTILHVGSPWAGLRVLEIGCGEGDLAFRIQEETDEYMRVIDYSEEAIKKLQSREEYWSPDRDIHAFCGDFHIDAPRRKMDRIVMQGVLEHLDNPWQELEWMIDNLLTPAGDIITSSPCFCNPRGIVWMTLATLFDAPMSLTDLHFLHPWQFEEFAGLHGLKITMELCDYDWGNGKTCMRDLEQRLPKVFPDMDREKITQLLDWLSRAKGMMNGEGATAVYRLSRK